MTDEIRSNPHPDAAADQAAEQERLDEETRRRFHEDPGDPKDRLSDAEEDRLMQQTTARELHP
jgi:hypothetical protein